MTYAVDTPEAIVGRIAPYAPTFHRCLREAIRSAREYFRSRHEAVEPWLFAHQVRFELKRLLAEALPPGTPIEIVEHTTMSSVVVRVEDVEIRVRKSEPGEVPPPGRSERMQAWYAQTLDGSVSQNVLLLWHVDDRHEYLGLDVAFPSGGSAYAPLVRWNVPLAEAATPADDLEISLPADDSRVVRRAGDRRP